ncbi:hypothetical protein F5Y18DRAFT_179395 [Xylariaceae sp. FL1019]|nr:hypothetical protein F5Y18DRAFT_179395 [Xylariaceae sp. FL1019]
MLLTRLLVFVTWIAVSALCQTVQDDWFTPKNGDIWYTGQTYTISWDSGLQDNFAYYCPACDTSNVDLWITGTTKNYYRIKSGVDVQTDLSIDWTIPDTWEADTWVFRFTSSGTRWQSGGEEISGNVFSISVTPTTASSSTSSTVSSIPGTVASYTSIIGPISSTTISSSTTTGTTTSISATTMSSATPTSSPETTSDHQDGLSTGAKAGIGVGAAVGGIILFALGFLLAKRQRKNKAAAAGRAYPQAWDGQGGAGYGNAYQYTGPAEMWNNEHVAELPDRK